MTTNLLRQHHCTRKNTSFCTQGMNATIHSTKDDSTTPIVVIDYPTEQERGQRLTPSCPNIQIQTSRSSSRTVDGLRSNSSSKNTAPMPRFFVVVPRTRTGTARQRSSTARSSAPTTRPLVQRHARQESSMDAFSRDMVCPVLLMTGDGPRAAKAATSRRRPTTPP